MFCKCHRINNISFICIVPYVGIHELSLNGKKRKGDRERLNV